MDEKGKKPQPHIYSIELIMEEKEEKPRPQILGACGAPIAHSFLAENCDRHGSI
jgi:hypothetical protein